MKINFYKLFAALSALLLVITFYDCKNNNTSSNQNASSSTALKSEDDFDMRSLQTFDKNSKDPFAGVWHITDGEGSKLSNFTYIFDGNGKASIVIDTIGYCGTYTKDSDSQNTFKCQLMFGINGTYKYKFSDSNNKVILTNSESNKTTTMEKLAGFDILPVPDKNPVVDQNLLGAWKSSNGEYFYFDGSGLMYHNQYGTIFTYYKYSAKDGVITAVYKMQNETTEKFEYTLKEDVLTIDGFEYTRISTSELDKF